MANSNALPLAAAVTVPPVVLARIYQISTISGNPRPIYSDLTISMSSIRRITFDRKWILSHSAGSLNIAPAYGTKFQQNRTIRGWVISIWPFHLSAFRHLRFVCIANSGTIKHRVTKFACSMGFLAMADRMVWPSSLSRDRKWPRPPIRRKTRFWTRVTPVA